MANISALWVFWTDWYVRKSCSSYKTSSLACSCERPLLPGKEGGTSNNQRKKVRRTTSYPNRYSNRGAGVGTAALRRPASSAKLTGRDLQSATRSNRKSDGRKDCSWLRTSGCHDRRTCILSSSHPRLYPLLFSPATASSPLRRAEDEAGAECSMIVIACTCAAAHGDVGQVLQHGRRGAREQHAVRRCVTERIAAQRGFHPCRNPSTECHRR